MIFLPHRLWAEWFVRRDGVSTFLSWAVARTAGPTPVTLLESSSPYGSRRVTVEYDGLTTAAYLHDDTAVISATWIANHQPAPDSIDSGPRPGSTPAARR